MNLKSGMIQGFEQFSQFHSLKEFNTHLEMWLSDYKKEFSKGELVGLKRLARYTAKVPGVSNAKIGTVLKAIHEEYHDNGISRSTFKRMIIKAKTIGILTVYETERKNGSQSSNLYIFNRYPTNEPPKDDQMNHHKETIGLTKTNKQYINNRKDDHINQIQQLAILTKEVDINHTFVGDHVPQSFVDQIKYFYSDVKTIEEYWRMVYIAAWRNNCEERLDWMVETANQAFRLLIRKIKLTRGVKNPIAYFYKIVLEKLCILYYQEIDEMFENGELN
ncbi:hypothetical protein [Bacillus sp. JJ1764]|uniref:hypothetical protein n=1 Tax=Bacillus sp. JJ1764 TaxID=3122964 RepID=UPI003000EC7C